MANRIELNEKETEGVVGGILYWDANTGTVYAHDNPDAVYSFTDYTECCQWLVGNWNKKQTEACLIAMEKAGLVSKL